MLDVNVNGWSQSDDDCMQYRKYRGERVYSFIQAVWLDSYEKPEGEYAVVTMDIDLKEFSLGDIELAICSYYPGGIKEMERNYTEPLGKLDSLIAECYFEEHSIQDCYSLGGTYTWQEAEEKIREYIETH